MMKNYTILFCLLATAWLSHRTAGLPSPIYREFDRLAVASSGLFMGSHGSGQSPASDWPRSKRQTAVNRAGATPDSLKQIQLGSAARFDCKLEIEDIPETSVWWIKDNANLTITDPGKFDLQVSKESKEGVIRSSLTINNVTWSDEGDYQCRAGDGGNVLLEGNLEHLAIHSTPRLIDKVNGAGIRNESLELSCTFEGNPLPNITWIFNGKNVEENDFKYEITASLISKRSTKSLIKILRLDHPDNGTYICYAQNPHKAIAEVVEGIVYDVPNVTIEHVVAVSSSKLFLNWTVNEWNQPITEYSLSFRKKDENAWAYHLASKIQPVSTSYLMAELEPATSYKIKLAASNEVGLGLYHTYESWVTTLDFDPKFVPEISIKGVTKNAITVGWTEPPEKVAPYIHFYKVTKRTGEEILEVIHSDKFPIHLWDNLNSATTYEFTVSACNMYSKECSPQSPVMSGTTYDGVSGPPADVQMNCRYDNVSNMNWVDVKWQPPLKPNGNIEFYNVELTGRARFKDENGKITVISTSPQTKTEDSSSSTAVKMTRFDFLEPNTNYSVRVCAVTGSKECGQWRSAACTMGPRAPLATEFSRFIWRPEEIKSRTDAGGGGGYPSASGRSQQFRLSIPRLSGRNGAVCCIRVVVVRLKPGQDMALLPPPAHINITSYGQVHQPDGWGGYIAEIVSSIYMGREIVVGDGKNTAALGLGSCPECTPSFRGGSAVNSAGESASVIQQQLALRREIQKRFTGGLLEASTAGNSGLKPVEDGLLDPANNYTAFIEVVIESPSSDASLIGRSAFMEPSRTDIDVSAMEVNTVLVSVLGILAGLVLVALLLLTVLFVLRRYSKQVASQQGGVEMDLKHTFRHFCSTLRRGVAGGHHSQFLLTQENFATPDLPPIDKDGMVAAYLERHKDSDYGFQSEFESLPDSYNDRTTAACDAPFNKSKNRYPDIKAYDQTRVKLSPVEGVEGSDYINANLVVGYKERKRWICAQGPLISTLDDFWRMIHEQGVEIVIMLTNLEEYSRIKCAQYWPGAGSSVYGALTVNFVQEKRYSDYVVRELKLTPTAEPAKARQIQHFHYLQWKDFNAPEHAPAMLKFVKRINEAWSGSSPILVHCSAGVGRSGTLIAIDSLTQQMWEEGNVSIFQTVSDLRRQRNYLVQSVKQYQFVYRAIMEYAQFGDTETTASRVKEHWVALAGEKDGLTNEFARLAKVVDDRKALSVATNAENKTKNGSEQTVPYDRNRVILTPDGTRPHSTYINASFIEGYYNDESFIITQDPLEETVMDFWRMVVEHNVATMVVLSSEGNFWQYWPGQQGESRDFGYITVNNTSRENRVAYVKREFTVYNQKSFEEVHLTHFHYTEWPNTATEDDVDDVSIPNSTHGLLGLMEHALAHQEQASLKGPIAVHCRYGSGRSSVYVVLSILVQQIKREERCDVFTAVRKLRAQRQGMIQDLQQYEFVYRAIADYVELYLNKEEEYEYSVPVGTANNTGTAKSVKSVHSGKSNGSGPYSVPVGTNKSGSGSS